MGHKPSSKIYPQKVVQPQIWFTLQFLPGTNIETFFYEIKIAMSSSPLYWDICPNWFQKSIEGLGKKYRPTFLPSFLTNHLWPVWFKAPPSSVVGSYQIWVLFMLYLPNEQLSPRQPLKHSHLVVSFATIAIQFPLLLQGWGGRVQGVTSEREQNDRIIRRL